MKWEDAAEKILVTMLGKLGFEVEVEHISTEDGLCLQVKCADTKHIIGRNGDRLEDLQYLVNRILMKHFPDAPRVKVDCDSYRLLQEEKLIQNAIELAQRVKESGRSVRTRPLNAYYRRIVHNALVDYEGVVTSSPNGNARYKRIEIKAV